MKYSASIYSSKSDNCMELVHQLEPYGLDYWHVDSIENLDVFDDIREVKKHSNVDIDLHIISRQPEKYIEKLEEIYIERVAFQVEELPSHIETGFSHSNFERCHRRYHSKI
jgi:ribulose-phosphate 3-epimerase